MGVTADQDGQSWLPLFLEFKWPSVAYAPDILAWDVFFPLSVLSAAPVFGGSRLTTSIRLLMIASSVLAVGGLSGVIVGDMQLRKIGIVAYVGVFPVARCCWPSCSIERHRQRRRRGPLTRERNQADLDG